MLFRPIAAEHGYRVENRRKCWRRCDTFCTSGMYGVSRDVVRALTAETTASIPTTNFAQRNNQQAYIVGCAPGTKSAIYNWFVHRRH